MFTFLTHWDWAFPLVPEDDLSLLLSSILILVEHVSIFYAQFANDSTCCVRFFCSVHAPTSRSSFVPLPTPPMGCPLRSLPALLQVVRRQPAEAVRGGGGAGHLFPVCPPPPRPQASHRPRRCVPGVSHPGKGSRGALGNGWTCGPAPPPHHMRLSCRFGPLQSIRMLRTQGVRGALGTALVTFENVEDAPRGGEGQRTPSVRTCVQKE